MTVLLDKIKAQITVQPLDIPLFKGIEALADREIFLLRLDNIKLAHQGALTGNKVFKLLPVLRALNESGGQHNHSKRNHSQPLISFGGPWSNHLHALAALGYEYSVPTVGIVRAERKAQLTPTLQDCIAMGMQLHFVSRADFQALQAETMRNRIENLFGEGTIIPVGGSSPAGVAGALQMGDCLLDILPEQVSSIWLAGATGGTAAGMIAAISRRSMVNTVSVNVVNVLKHCELAHDIAVFLQQFGLAEPGQSVEKGTGSQAWRVLNEYHCGGYARVNNELRDFHTELEAQLGEPVDTVYMAKLLFALRQHYRARSLSSDLTKADGAIAILHSGGQQGRRRCA